MKKANNTIKKQEEIEIKSKMRRKAKVVFNELFLQILDRTNEELLKEDAEKNTKLQENMIDGIIKTINQVNLEPIDSRIFVMVFARLLISALVTEEE